MDSQEGHPSVELRGVTKRFDAFTAVDDLSLELGQGEFFTLLGPERLRQDDDPADDRRLRAARARARS